MTLASRTTYAQWSEPDKNAIQKQMLDLLGAYGRKTYPSIFQALELPHQTGTARLQELMDMALIKTVGTMKRRNNGRKSTLSILKLSPVGDWLRMQPNPDTILAEMNKARRELETKRADAMRGIKAEHVAAVRQAVLDVVGEG